MQEAAGGSGQTEAGAQVITWFRYVPHSALVLHLAMGWEIADEMHGTNHGEFSVLCKWPKEGEPPK